jgi:MYXO-CTERM domain-containing protein
MAQKRSSQRGVVRMASSVILAGFTALLSVTGCSSEQPSSPGENLGSSAQALTCNPLTIPQVCNNDDCSTFNCKGPAGGCLLLDQKRDGDSCVTLGNATGQCLTPPNGKFPICCTGCVLDNRGALTCIDKPDASACGLGGSACVTCSKGNECNVDVCTKAGKCATLPVPDDKVECKDAGGLLGGCYKGSCCAGCIDVNGACQTGTAVALCGTSGGAVHADCKTCADTDVCTTDLCKDGTCGHGNTADNTPCADGNKCDGAETCQAGKCTDQAGFMCPTDGNACHSPTCNAGMTCGQLLLNNTDCPDANLCNGTEKCNNGVCNVPGTPKNCNDKNPCTFDDCDPKTGACLNTPVPGGELCENGDVCDGVGVCNDKGVCDVQPAEPCVANRPNDPCNVYACDKLKGCVVASFTTAACSDGDPCTLNDKCNGAGSCAGGAQQKCDDGNECTTDSCVAFQGCKAVAGNEGAACNDGNDCSTGDKCVSGKCLASGGKTCPDDTNPCTTASCDPANQVCGQTNDNTAKCQTDKCHQFTQCGSDGNCPVGALIDCADTNPCTKDDCDPATGCTHDPDDSATCSDNDLCTEGDACRKGKCVTQPVVCEALDDCHKVGTCNDKSGFCDAPRANAGTACENDTGKCDDKGKCTPNPATGEGGAGGEPTTGTAGDGTGGTVAAEGGKGAVTPVGGAGNEGGEPGTVGSGGKAGKSGGGSASNEGGAPEVPENVFVRTPGGCSCSVPSSEPSNLAWLGGLALAGALARRRARRTGSNQPRHL